MLEGRKHHNVGGVGELFDRTHSRVNTDQVVQTWGRKEFVVRTKQSRLLGRACVDIVAQDVFLIDASGLCQQLLQLNRF